MKKIFINITNSFLSLHPRFFVKLFCGNIWDLRVFVQNSYSQTSRMKKIIAGFLLTLAEKYWESYGSWIGANAIIEEPPTFPHGPFGIFISSGAHIGKKCVIFQHVTIGSNTLRDSRRKGSPNLGDNVYIGCGAKIIGNINVGNNARIGANCVVVKDVPDNSVTVIRCIESIQKNEIMDNAFVPLWMIEKND